MPTKKSAKSKSAEIPVGLPTYEEVARRAFEIYLARGGYDGEHHQDWEAAEAELGKATEAPARKLEEDHPSAKGDPSGTASMDP